MFWTSPGWWLASVPVQPGQAGHPRQSRQDGRAQPGRGAQEQTALLNYCGQYRIHKN